MADNNFNSKEFDLFFSYNHEASADKATELFAHLKTHYNNSIKIWLDRNELNANDTLAAQLMRGLTNSKCVVCFISKQYSFSKNCLRELSYATNSSFSIILMFDHYNQISHEAQFLIANLARINFYRNQETTNMWSGESYDLLIRSIDKHISPQINPKPIYKSHATIILNKKSDV